MPPSNSLIYELAFVNAYIEPIHKTFESKFPDEKSSEKVISKIKDTKLCKSSNERKALNQDLKNQLEELFIKVINANGVINIKTFNIIYLSE